MYANVVLETCLFQVAVNDCMSFPFLPFYYLVIHFLLGCAPIYILSRSLSFLDQIHPLPAMSSKNNCSSDDNVATGSQIQHWWGQISQSHDDNTQFLMPTTLFQPSLSNTDDTHYPVSIQSLCVLPIMYITSLCASPQATTFHAHFPMTTKLASAYTKLSAATGTTQISSQWTPLITSLNHFFSIYRGAVIELELYLLTIYNQPLLVIDPHVAFQHPVYVQFHGHTKCLFSKGWPCWQCS